LAEVAAVVHLSLQPCHLVVVDLVELQFLMFQLLENLSI
jgi:hypothetical protein